MEIIYRTIDGKEFTDMHEADHHELHLLHESVIMFDPHGESTIDPDRAVAVFLCGEEAAGAFRKMCSDGAPGIRDYDEGIFVWDSVNGEYNYIEMEALRAAYAALDCAIKKGWAD